MHRRRRRLRAIFAARDLPGRPDGDGVRGPPRRAGEPSGPLRDLCARAGEANQSAEPGGEGQSPARSHPAGLGAGKPRLPAGLGLAVPARRHAGTPSLLVRAAARGDFRGDRRQAAARRLECRRDADRTAHPVPGAGDPPGARCGRADRGRTHARRADTGLPLRSARQRKPHASRRRAGLAPAARRNPRLSRRAGGRERGACRRPAARRPDAARAQRPGMHRPRPGQRGDRRVADPVRENGTQPHHPRFRQDRRGAPLSGHRSWRRSRRSPGMCCRAWARTSSGSRAS